ncbi:MAG: gliding motility-associated C-terminal domain-containing protein [Vicingus serpentipes]|nr:gliding motility-associated C-terminal domain-containing protein [Vicingus serpentipes]
MKQSIKIYTTLIVLLASNYSYSQIQLDRQVIGSTGGHTTGTTISLSSTVGEAVTQTLFSTSTIILTQGFQQPQLTSDSILDYEIINESCVGAKNGSIYIDNVLGCPGPYKLIIRATRDSIEIGADTLSAGDYDILVLGSSGCSYSTTLNVGLDSDENCVLKFYSGITPNGDGINDVWWIDNIELFPENTVQIFNRWGREIWFGENYDNKNVVWEGNSNSNEEMADATYFYIAKVSGKTYKGWVELTR